MSSRVTLRESLEMTNFNLSNLTAIVTGGGQGIGRATADRLLEAGANVVIGDLDPPANFGGEVFKVDVSKESDIKALVDFAVEQYGGLDVVVNNAGVHRSYDTVEQATELDYDICHNVNLKGVAFAMKHAASAMQNGGSIINISSASAVLGVSALGTYAASKAAVIGLTKTAAIELAPKGIRVNAICPSSVNTPMAMADGGEKLLAVEAVATPLGRICEPEELAALIQFLAAPDCSFLTGQAINLCGGLTAGLSEALWAKLEG